MVAVIVLCIVGLAFAVAAVFVVREAGRLTHEPPPVLFSLDEAYDWVVERVPDEVAATLTPADLRKILGWQVEFFGRQGVTANGAHATAPRLSVLVGPEVVEFILAQAEAAGIRFIPEQVYPVIEIQLEYLRAIGAVSSPVEGPPDPEGAGGPSDS